MFRALTKERANETREMTVVLSYVKQQLKERANENREMTVVLSYVKQQAGGEFMRFKCITKENGSIYKSTRERVNSRN